MADERETIFLVDDTATVLSMGKDILSGRYRVITFDSGERLFKALDRIIPDLILLDLEMPEMSGYEVIERLKSNPETTHIPVIFLTAIDNAEAEVKGFDLGAADYISKPMSPPRLLKRVEVCLAMERQKLALINYNNNLEGMVESKTRTVIELKNAILKVMSELVEHRDEITGGHIDRTQRYAKILIDAMRKHNVYMQKVNVWDEQLVLQSSQLHDIGKIAIKDSILFKPGKLTNEEFEVMKTHTTFGEKIILSLEETTVDSEFLEYARIFVISHHEKWNGTGYPKGLSGEDIPLLGRIMAVADVYDALVSERPYKPAFPHSKVMDIIRDENGKHFDPLLVALLEGVHEEFEEVSKIVVI